MQYDPGSLIHQVVHCIMMHFVLWCTLYHYALWHSSEKPSFGLHYDALCITMHCLWVEQMISSFWKLSPRNQSRYHSPLSFAIRYTTFICLLLIGKIGRLDWQHINLDLLQIIWIFWDRFCFKDLVFWQVLYQLRWPFSLECMSISSSFKWKDEKISISTGYAGYRHALL